MQKIFDPLENIEVRETLGKGKSLFSKKTFKKDELIFVQFGAIHSHPTDYTIPILENVFIEPRIPGSLGMYMNHSCEPNIGFKNGTLVVAMRDIQKDEELCTHYGFLGYEYGYEKDFITGEFLKFDQTCNCNAKSCTGKLGCYKDMSIEDRRKYEKYIQPYLIEKYGI